MLSYGGVTAVPFFWDTGASLDFTLGSDNHFRAIALANDDIMKVTVDPSSDTYTSFSEGFSMDNAAFTGGISWINTALAGFTSKFTFYYYNLYMKEDAGEYLKMHVAQEDFGLKWEAELNAGEFLWLKHELGFGADVQRVHDGANIYLEYDIVHGTNDPAYVYIDGWHTNRGGYIQDRMNILKGLDLTAGLRYDKNDKVKRDTTMPRFSIAWQSDADTTWKAAWGLYSQFPGDVQLNDVFGNPRLNPETAQHVVAGVERKLTAEITAKLNFYYKYYTDMIVNNKGLVIYENSGTGMAKGAELFVNAKYGEKFFGWISYALSRSDRMSPPVNKWVQYRYDQTHILTAVGSYSFTPAWSLGAKLHYNSGPLVKTFQSAYQDSEGYWHGVFSDDYDRRLEDYLRLDVRTDYTFKFDGWKLNLYVEIINLLNRANPQDIMYNLDYTDTMEIDNLPFMPYIGVEAEF
jgi:outer membrane receptor protein involved in Fe transport